FKKRLKEEFLRAKRHGNELSVVVVGFKNLEKINEMFGHQIGNYVIMKMANSLLNKTRTSDVLARSDNDKFYIILPQTDTQGCFFEAERIRVTLSSVDYFDDDLLETVKYPKRKINEFQNIGINLGVVTYPVKGETVREYHDLLHFSEEALKKSRASGDSLTMAYGVMDN
ncbi:MAG: diguanylate cyclase, partial [Calditrichaceae bacterium]